MSLANDYRRQAAWRDWTSAFEALPPLEGMTILDLGCAIGDQSAELVKRGARVIGFDDNEDLLKIARGRGLERAEFLHHNLTNELPDLGTRVDGIWSSFTAAYFVDLPTVLRSWTKPLAPGGFIAVTEMDDLFAHEPITNTTLQLFDRFYDDARDAKRYDFRMGRKVRASLETCGFTIVTERFLADQELSFAGPAAPEVLEAWSSRLDRLVALKTFAGSAFEALRADFLACLERPEHRSETRVHFYLGTR